MGLHEGIISFSTDPTPWMGKSKDEESYRTKSEWHEVREVKYTARPECSSIGAMEIDESIEISNIEC